MAISSPPRGAGQSVPDRQWTLVSALILALVALLALSTIVVVLLVRGGPPASGVRGSGVAATQSRVLPRFSRLDLAGSTTVTVVAGGRQTVWLPGSGVLYASGTAARLDVTLGGSGLAQLSNLIARDAHAAVTGSGLIRVTATANLNATVSGSGAVIYSGNPSQVTRNVTGTGAVIPG